ncbi:TetR/AcrR family transcriptional regulator [Kineococcus sp. SYSU DK001]|uniref:TetR/AcrR family transcriptional regulator n=1 Tax=Kineococcus sp. SYSU DK001 TaxID=3383122 RepID=UPI003D7C7ACD
MSLPEPVQAQAPASRERTILDAAGRLFQQHGYDGTSVSRIAKLAGMTPANLYWYFPSKQVLLRDVLVDLYRTSLESLQAADDATASPSTRLCAYVRTLVTLQLSDPETVNHSYLALQSALDEESALVISRWQREHRDLLRDILLAGVGDGSFDVPDVSVAASFLATGAEHVYTWFRHDGRRSGSEVAELFADHALRSVQPRP